MGLATYLIPVIAYILLTKWKHHDPKRVGIKYDKVAPEFLGYPPNLHNPW